MTQTHAVTPPPPSAGDGTNQTSSGPGEEGKTEDSNVTANITPAPSSGDPDFSERESLVVLLRGLTEGFG